MKNTKFGSRILVVVLLSLLSTLGQSQTQCLKSFQNTVGGNSDDVAYDIADAGSGQFFTAGTTTSYGAGGLDILITKMSSSGAVLWSNAYGGGADETVRKIKSTTDGGLLVIGQTKSFTYSQGEMFCFKIDPTGKLLWSKRFGIGSQFGDLGMDIIQTTDGGFAMSGIINVNGKVADLSLIRMDNAANILWSKRFDSNQGENGVGILQRGDTLIVTGDVDNNGSYFNTIVNKIKLSDGSFIAGQKIVPVSRGVFNPYIYDDNGNGYFISEHIIDGASYSAMQPTILKLDNNFNIIKTYSYKVPGVLTNDYYTGFAQMPNGFVACASTTGSATTGYLFYINTDGSVRWSKNFAGKSNRSLYKLQHIGSQIVTVGRDNSSGKGDDFFVAGFNDGGYIDSLCHPDTSAVAITNPAFNQSTFTWASINDQAFANTSAPITVTTVSLSPQPMCDACPVSAVTPAFKVTDSVCVNAPVKIRNTTVGASSYYWSFCTADINQPPVGTNYPLSQSNRPVYIDYVVSNGNYYGFVTSNYPAGLLRLDFGNSLLNTPVITNLGTVNGLLSSGTEGIQVVNSQGIWYLIIVQGDASTGLVSPNIVTVVLGTDIANNAPTGTNWGNIGNLGYPHDLYVFQDNGHWYGVTANSANNSVTRFDFGTSFANAPTGVNLGNVGNLNGPTGLNAAKDDSGNWHVFVTNALSSTLSRLDFGNSLLNTPTGVNLGNIGGTFNVCWDVEIIKYCGTSLGYVINAENGVSGGEIVKLDFNGSLTNTPTAVDFGDIGNLNFPHCLSKLFRVGANVYSFITDVVTNSYTALEFPGCTNSSIPNSTAQNPPDVSYSTPGIYNINLTVDDGLPTQNSLCQQVVVLGPPTLKVNNDTTICAGDTLHLIASGAASYQWSPTAVLSYPDSSNTLAKPTATTKFYVTGKNTIGCAAKDSVLVNVSQCTVVTPNFTLPDTVCVNSPVKITNTSSGASTYYWSFCTANVNNNPAGTNLGTLGGAFHTPVFMDIATQNGNYYGFVTDFATGELTRLDFGTSMLNTPTYVNLGSFGGILPYATTEGIQVVQNAGNWYAIIVGGTPNSKIVKIAFGASLTNPAPVATDWGNIGNLALPHDLSVFEENNNWYGITINKNNNSVTRFNFGNSFENIPTGINFGNLGNINTPTGMFAIKDNTWHVFIVNSYDGDNPTDYGTITRLDFGSSLLNTPTAVNLGNLGNTLHNPRDISIIKFCGEAIGYVVNHLTNDIVKLDFNDNLESTPTAVSLGNVAGFNFPHSISKLFRAGADIYAFIPNAADNTMSRIEFAGCTNSSVPNSTLQNPGLVTYQTPGVYNINLTIDDGLSTQNSLCKQIVVVGKPTPDFNFTQNVCNPLSIEFANETKNASSLNWNFGNGTSVQNDSAPLITYSAYNTYTVKLVAKTLFGCTDSITKNILVNIVTDSVITNSDTSICGKGTVQLKALPALSYCWSPAAGLSATNIANPVATITKSGTYYLNEQAIGKNLIVNGDFSQGNQGFTSGYTYVSNNIVEGQYFVGPNPQIWNGGMSPCADHTGNKENMLMLNGSQVAGLNAWSQKVAVKPNTNYIFSAWIQTISPGYPAQLQFYINGNTVDSVFTSDANTCSWRQFFITWNSGDSTNATISLIDNNTSNLGNDYALDDISFAESFIKHDSINIKVIAPPVVKISADTIICAGSSAQLTASANGSPVYSWSPSTTLNDSTKANPIASPLITTEYYVQVKGTGGCTASDSVKVSVLQQPTVKSIADTSICSGTTIQLATTAVNGTKYSWSPAKGLSDSSLLSPSASPLSNTSYVITVNPGSQCFAKDTVNVTVNPSPTVKASGDTTICAGSTAQLVATATGNVSYAWSPKAGLNDSSIYNPLASPTATTKYFITVTSTNNCTAKDSTTLSVLPQPTVKSIADTSICSGTTIQLATTAVNGTKYSWSPNTGLSSTTVLSPAATPMVNTSYVITVNPGSQCFAKDTVNITVKPSPTVKASGDTAICAGASAQLVATAPGNVSYAWSPKTGLSDSTIYNPVASPTATTRYFITVTLNNQCSAKDSVTLSALPQPTVKSIPDTSICSGTTIQLATTAVNGSTYRWSPVTGLSSTTVQSPSATPMVNTSYIITVNPGSQCFAKDTVNITVKPLPTLAVSADTLICAGGSAPLQATSPNNVTYAWSPSIGLTGTSIPNPVASPSSTTTYSITISDNNQCSTSGSVTVTVVPQPVFAVNPPSATICIGNSLPVNATGGDKYQWYPTTGVANPTAASTTVSPQATTTYFVVINNSTCRVTDTLQTVVNVTNKPDITIGKSNDLDCFTSQARLYATGGNQYIWSPSSTLDNPYTASPVASPLQTTTYYVEVRKGIGCAAIDSIQVRVLTDMQNNYLVPSAFTPNGDGFNDCFKVTLWGGIKTMDFSVYDRWGVRVFHTNNPNDCWDGNYNGQRQPPGAYVYQIQANTVCGQVYRKGTVVLVR